MDLSDALSLVNERVRGLAPYHLEPRQTAIKLNQNENPYDWPAPIKEEIADFCRQRPFNRYPDFVPDGLKRKLSEYTGVPADGIIAGNGSNEMILVLLIALAGTGADVVLCQPTFTVYRLLARGLGAREHTVSLNSDLQFDVDEICGAVSAHPRSVLILCSPNNPTGSFLDERDIRFILSKHTGMLILDQAYVEFGGYNAIPLLKDNPNLIVTRTFSKAFSGAGLRLGYMLGTPAVIAEINKVKLPYNINFFSDHVGQVLLSRPDLVRQRVEELVRERDGLLAFLRTLPFDNVYPSASNFICMRTRRAVELFSFLQRKGILIRDVSRYPLLQDCLRVNVGTPDENRAFGSAAAEFFATPPALQGAGARHTGKDGSS
jgi:histidinol-phosphate aminotransferase